MTSHSHRAEVSCRPTTPLEARILTSFHEEGESAKTTDRSQLQALLKYCRTHKATLSPQSFGQMMRNPIYVGKVESPDYFCGRPLTGSWSKGRNGHYAYYHCQRQCRAVNVSKAALEGAFVDDVRRKSIQSNRHNGTTFQLLGAVREC